MGQEESPRPSSKILKRTFKQLSRIIITFSRNILTSNVTSAQCKSEESHVDVDCSKSDIVNVDTANGVPDSRDCLDKGYHEIQTIRHETTFEKSKFIFGQRHLSLAEMHGRDCKDTTCDSVRWARVFDPVCLPSGDIKESSRSELGNVHFSLRSLNGSSGIWDIDTPLGLFESTSRPIAHSTGKALLAKWDQQHIRYYLMRESTEGSTCIQQTTHILVTRTAHEDLSPYNPLHPGGPWRVLWSQERGIFVHFVKRRNSSTNNLTEATIRFYLDESVLGATRELADQFAQGTFVSFAECQTRIGTTSSGLVDNHVVTGPLRVILATCCYRWPGGIILRANGEFCPDRIISRFHAFHARVSRDVLIRAGDSVSRSSPITGTSSVNRTSPVPLDEQSTQRVQDSLKAFRLATYSQVETLSEDYSEIVSEMQTFLLMLSSGIEQLNNLHALKRALQPFVLFLASNGLDVDLTITNSMSMYEDGELQDLEVLYRFVLGLLPDRKSHQIFRDCIGARIAMAVDST